MQATRVVLAVLLCGALSSRASAQQVRGSVSVVGGSATDVRGVTSRAVTVSPAVAYTPDPRLVLGLDASATRFDNQQWSLGGGPSLSARLPLSRYAAATLDADAAYTNTSYQFSYATAAALPALELSLGPVTGYAGARGELASTAATLTAPGAPGVLGAPTTTSRSISASRRAAGILFGANARLTSDEAETMIVGVRQEQTGVDSIHYTERSASASVLKGIVAIGGTIGVRDESGARTTFGSALVTIAVTPIAAVQLSGGAYPTDHLIGTPAGRYLNVGMSLRTGRSPPSRVVRPEGVAAPRSGMTRLAIRAQSATRVDVLGDFTNWHPIAARRADNGVWYVDLRIPPGQYRYSFRVDGATWAIPEGAAPADDDFGGKTAWLTVSDTPRTTAR
ncbi:MAG TPA: glycogen-binding domain-containing protein [Gemmatimonadaceae bacterium]|nr:glycogen-binding domain-containing protein [Gemmatimonadaceae bacterium]